MEGQQLQDMRAMRQLIYQAEEMDRRGATPEEAVTLFSEAGEIHDRMMQEMNKHAGIGMRIDKEIAYTLLFNLSSEAKQQLSYFGWEDLVAIYQGIENDDLLALSGTLSENKDRNDDQWPSWSGFTTGDGWQLWTRARGSNAGSVLVCDLGNTEDGKNVVLHCAIRRHN